MFEYLEIIRALGDRNRVRALMALRKQELCVCQLIELLGLAASTVSKHMSILKHARLVEDRKNGRWNYYKLTSSDASNKITNILNWTFETLERDPQILEDSSRLDEILEIHSMDSCKQSKDKLKILFLCTSNSCRSQMAEGWARHLKSNTIEAYSAGTENHGMNPNAVKVMAEAGIDISNQKSKQISDLPDIVFDYVVTVCGEADKNCPVFPGKAIKIHHGFDDPPKLALTAKSEEEAMNHYRRVRDEVKQFVSSLPASILAEKRV